MPVRGHSWDYWDAKLTSQGYDKETRGGIIGKWEKEESNEADNTSLQSPKGKEDPREKTSLQSTQGTEQEELPPAEPVAVPDPDDGELEPVETIVIKDGESYKKVKVYEVKSYEKRHAQGVYGDETHLVEVKEKIAKEQEMPKCQFCKGTGKVIVEKKGVKECPRCEGEGFTDKPQEELENTKDAQGIDDITQEEEISGDLQPELGDNVQLEEPIQEEPLEGQLVEEEEIQEEPTVSDEEGDDIDNDEDGLTDEKDEEVVDEKAFESFVNQKIKVLQAKRPNKAVSLLMGTEVDGEAGGKKIKGTLAYAGVSLNDRVYLPEELAKGDGMTLPLLLNHSSVAGAEGELHRLDNDMQDHLTQGRDYKVGEVTLTWIPDDLTLYYEGAIENKFFQKEVDDMDMAVSLGIYYDSDSPQLCNDSCYTVIKGAEFREVSLVYHAGFPVATIEEIESKLKKRAMETIKDEPNINPEVPQFMNVAKEVDGFLETPELQKIRNHWDNVMSVEDKHSMLERMAYLYRNNPTDSFDSLYWEVKESVALSVGELVGLDVDMGTFYGQKHLEDLQNQYWD